jgi:Flp pilus assembly protein TadG
MVTAELAVGLPVLLVVLAVLLSAMSVASARVRAQDAAREAARAAARGDSGAGRRLALDAAPGSSVAVARTGDTVTATVRLRAHLLASWLPAVTVSGRAVAAVEPDTDSGIPP